MTESSPRKAPQADPEPARANQASPNEARANQASANQVDAKTVGPDQDGVPQDGTPDAHDDGKPDMDEVKRKFREALDRKREIHADGSAASGRDPSKIHDAHGPARSRRDFRRKSG